mgnify:CR=1 FL=1
MTRVEAPANIGVLVWARETLGFDMDRAAKAAGVSPEKVKEWESGTSKPTLRQLEKLADLYRQPLISFFQDDHPEELDLPTDYRVIHSGDDVSLAPETIIAIGEARWRQSVAESLRREMDINISFRPLRAENQIDAESLAEKARKRLDVTEEKQALWAKDYRNTFKRWRELLEDAGILVFKFDFPRRNTRAFALTAKLAPVITVSANDFQNAMIFSLFHELAHLLLNQSSTCNDLEFRSKASSHNDKIEIFCNRFAGAFLVPAESLLQHRSVRNQFLHSLEENRIQELAHHFGVSCEVILRRLVILDYLDISFYKKWKNEQDEYWKEREPVKKGGGGKDTYKYTVISSQGNAYIDTVLNAYSENIISLSEASEYLAVKAKYVHELQEFLAKGGDMGE